jgi:SAM-dependent methyltransferase
VTNSQPDWVPPGIDTGRANAARVYDYWLGGSHNFRADQDAGRAMAALEPRVREITQANRAFLRRAVRFLAASGIRQFLDIGSGLPTQGNVHEVAQQAAPGARVAYADIDPVVAAHAAAILRGNPAAVAIQGDLREPGQILGRDAVRQLLDLGQPVGLLLSCVLHFLADADDPWRVVAELRDALAPGSYLLVSHGTYENDAAVARAAQKLYNQRVSATVQGRSRAEILRFFDGLDLVDPGLVYIPQWRPDPAEVAPDDPGRYACLVGVARKR